MSVSSMQKICTRRRHHHRGHTHADHDHNHVYHVGLRESSIPSRPNLKGPSNLAKNHKEGKAIF